MSCVLVKEFEGYEIYLGETIDNKFNWHKCMNWLIVFIILSFISSYLILSTFPAANRLSWDFNYILFFIITLVILVGMSCLACLFDDEIPSYYISNNASNINCKYIPKVSLDMDEIAISKAVKQTESDIMELNAKDSKIKMLAARCK